MSQKIKVVVPENYSPEKPIVIQILEGRAPEPKKTVQEMGVTFEGNIFAPGKYAENIINTEAEGQKFQNEQGIVIYDTDPNEPAIELLLNPNTNRASSILGKMTENPEVKGFSFNKDATFTNKTFAEFITKNAHLFAVKGEAKRLRKELQNFQAQFKTLVKKADDKQGNTEDYIATELDRTKANIPESISLKMPLFLGHEDVEFTAEVEITVTMNSGAPEARFGFFTEDLTQMKRDYVKKVLDEEINKLSKKFTCIQR